MICSLLENVELEMSQGSSDGGVHPTVRNENLEAQVRFGTENQKAIYKYSLIKNNVRNMVDIINGNLEREEKNKPNKII